MYIYISRLRVPNLRVPKEDKNQEKKQKFNKKL